MGGKVRSMSGTLVEKVAWEDPCANEDHKSKWWKISWTGICEEIMKRMWWFQTSRDTWRSTDKGFTGAWKDNYITTTKIKPPLWRQPGLRGKSIVQHLLLGKEWLMFALDDTLFVSLREGKPSLWIERLFVNALSNDSGASVNGCKTALCLPACGNFITLLLR